ncbi:MAG TPA: hypothetical protein VK324_12825, partial [Tepidisphaeraceae bacterium]|nr:hypothetical protein [Tepidisphaeraceae bacterium]
MLAAEYNVAVPVPFSWVVLLTLVAVFAASLATFLALIARWTDSRPRHAALEWAKQYGFRPGTLGGGGEWPVLPPGAVVAEPQRHEQFHKPARHTTILRLR